MSPAWTTADIPDQTARVAVVTGANAGLGLEIAHGLAAAGGHVVMACRNEAKAQAAAEVLRRRSPGAEVEVAALDLADLASVAGFARTFLAHHDRLDLLVNNAGLMAIDQARTAQGFEMQLGVNHLGHVALTAHLLPLLTGTPGSRVATMSSMGHRMGRLVADDLMFEQRGYQRWNAYFQSKLANLLFTSALQRRLAQAGSGTIAVAAHPGASRTDLGTEGGSVGNRLMGAVVPLTTQSAAMGALPMLRAATAPDVAGGEFYGPRWLVRGYPVRETPSRRARDEVSADILWQRSVDLTSVPMPVG